ncbi:MAG: hypothetical protein IKQ10_06750 [Oscillospiraceae bacterium]|nr:hypothetical protein [Oscillospiraceae bacterium]
MTKKNYRSSSLITGILFVLALGLLLFSTIGAARAALVESAEYETYVHTNDLSVAVNYEGDDVVQAFLGKDAEGKTNPWAPGKLYRGSVEVENTGHIDEFVRVVVHKYWKDGDGKRTDLDPSLIQVGFASGWSKIDSTAESETYVRSAKLTAQNAADMITSIKVDGSIVNEVEQVTEGKIITTTYKYDGMQIGIELEICAVQTGSKADATLSAWGKSVS